MIMSQASWKRFIPEGWSFKGMKRKGDRGTPVVVFINDATGDTRGFGPMALSGSWDGTDNDGGMKGAAARKLAADIAGQAFPITEKGLSDRTRHAAATKLFTS